MVVVLQYSHVLQTQTGIISQLSTAYRVTLCHTMSHCHCTGWKQPQLTASLTVWHLFYLLRADGVVRGREGHNERKGHRKGHWKEQGKGEDERKGGMEWDRRGREREREREKETGRRWRQRDTETDSDGEGGYVSNSSTETSMWLGQPAASST